MKKIISLFQRNYDGDHLVRDEIVAGAEWVINHEGVATRKFDGTCCMVKGGALYKRYDAKGGKTPPVGWIPAQDPDPKTGHWPGWLACQIDEPSDKWHNEGFKNLCISFKGNPPDGTYELCGPMTQGNPECFTQQTMVLHGASVLNAVPRSFSGLWRWFPAQNIEGIVWHHPDGRMVKIKKKDFGFKR